MYAVLVGSVFYWIASPVFPDGIFQTEILVPFLQAIFDTGFRPSRSFLELICTNGKRNSGTKFTRVQNFAYHLPRPWTDRFAHVNGKQPFLII